MKSSKFYSCPPETTGALIRQPYCESAFQLEVISTKGSELKQEYPKYQSSSVTNNTKQDISTISSSLHYHLSSKQASIENPASSD